MSAAILISPSLKNSSICLSPSPSMSKALREQKCLRPSTAWAAQTRRPVQRRTTSALPVFSSISRSAAEPQTGQTKFPCRPAGRRRPSRRRGRLSSDDFENLRDDVAGALHDDRVADPHVEPRDLVLVVQRGVGDDDAADGDGLAAWRPASARRCGRPGSRSPRRSSSRARPGTCAPPPSAGCARRSRAAPAARGRRPCRRRRRCRSRASPAAPRSRGNGASISAAEWQSLVSGLTGRPKRSNASIAPFCVVAIGALSFAPGVGEEFQRPLGGDRWRRAGAANRRRRCADWRRSACRRPAGAR